MASINGYEVKGIKEFQGHDGGGYYQCSIYRNGKKVAYYADDAWCGEPNCDFKNTSEEEDFWKAMVSYFEKKPNSFIVGLYNERPEQYKNERNNFIKYHPYISVEKVTKKSLTADIGCFVQELMKLKDVEKRYKKSVKQNYPTLIEVSDGYQISSLMTRYTDNLEERYKDKIAEIKSKLSGKEIDVLIITKLSDLDYVY